MINSFKIEIMFQEPKFPFVREKTNERYINYPPYFHERSGKRPFTSKLKVRTV